MRKLHTLTIIVFVALLSFVSTNSHAQIFSVVGTGVTYNTTTSFPAPYGNYWWGAKHQMYITAAELTAAGIAGGASISSIGFNVFATNSINHINWTVKVYATSVANPLATNWIATGLVATSTTSNVVPANGWNQTSFTPFIWNGSDNLVIETCFNNSSYVTNAQTYWTNTLTGTDIKTRWRNADIPTNCTDPSVSTSTNTRPNVRFEWVSPTPCTGAPAANSAVGPTAAICPNTSANLALATNYTLGGLTYQWQSSTVSAVGPYSSVPGATMASHATPNLTVNTYYQAVITCTTAGGTTTTSAWQVSISPTTTNTVPYYEGFEGISGDNKLPNCSWLASNMGITCLTYTGSNTLNRVPRTGTKFASFFYSPILSNYFYTNGIWLEAGVTYSAAVWYTTEYYGYNNWSNLSIMLGTSQSTTGLTTLASSNGPAISNIYKLLSNTFTVASTGLYYVAVKATTGSGSAQYLTWDDLSITIPCTGNSGNVPNVSLSANSTTICMGDPVNITASGADTYTWNTGVNGSSISETPAANTYYTVVGTNLLTGCTNTVTQFVQVNPSPNIMVITNKPVVCAGSPVNLTAYGADTYTWSSGMTGSFVTVFPGSTITYTVLGSNSFGCTSMMTQPITVNSLPNVSANSTSPGEMCVGEQRILTATGAQSFVWMSSSSPFVLSGNTVTISPNTTTTYTISGTDNNGCQNSTTLVQNVSECVGISEAGNTSGNVKIYPNPTSGEFNVEVRNALTKMIEVVDLTGRVVLSHTTVQEKIKLNVSGFASGVYYVKVHSGNSVEVVKLIKQ